MTPPYVSVDGAALRETRQRKGLGLNKCAQLAEMNASYLSRLERGKQSQVGPDIYRRILAALGLDPDDEWDALRPAGGQR
jgi:transcriptional regulator with XRE-family HTH domain